METVWVGRGFIAIGALLIAWLLPVTFPHLTGIPLVAAWLGVLILAVLGWRLTVPARSVAAPRDPDAIYQHGRMVGRVEVVEIKPHEGRIYFGHILDANELNRELPFEYRDWHVMFEGGIDDQSSSSGVMHRALHHVQTSIVGRDAS